MSTSPNVLLIMSDQHNRRYLGCAGHPYVRTPHLDALAAEGMRFSSAYCPSPLCGPSRMSFLTGLYPHETGVYANGQALASDLPTYAHAFTAAGYRTALVGRMHIIGDDQKHGFLEKLGSDVCASTIGGGLFPNLEGLHAGSGAIGFKRSGPGDSAYLHYDDQVADTACAWLRARTVGAPFMLTVGFALPHCPYVCSPEDYALYGDIDTLPGPAAETLAATHPWLRRLLDSQQDLPVSNEDYLRSLRAYCGCVTATDRRVGRLLETLADLGLDRNTIVVYTSDHGDAANEHGLWHKMTMFEGSAAVPLIMRGPGCGAARGVAEQAVNLIDIGPTLLDLAGAPALPHVSGRSFRALLDGDASRWENKTYCEYANRRAPAVCRMLRRGPWKFVYYHRMPCHLFNLESDPEEARNLAESPECADIVRELRHDALEGWNPTEIERQVAVWNARNAVIYGWYKAARPDDPEIYFPPAGVNRLDAVPDYTPQPTAPADSY